MKKLRLLFVILFLISGVLSACRSDNSPTAAQPQAAGIRVLTVESFLADMAANVIGDRGAVETLIPLGLDPHAFEPTPKDVSRIVESDVVIVNGAGLEEWLEETLQNAGGNRPMIIASEGLTPRPSAVTHAEKPGEKEHAVDPHFWFDPTLAVKYVENIRDGLIKVDPDGREIYTRNAGAYIETLRQLDAWAQEQVGQIPSEQRLMVTNHESFGYFADRYGFEIVGAVLPSVSANAAPSARQLADLVQEIRASGAKAIFLETGANPDIAEQIAQETGAKVVTGLYSHSLSAADGPAPTYVAMMRYNITLIVSALK